MNELSLTTDQPERVEYWRSLLKIEATVAVSLAKRRMQVDRILNLVPGMMLQFDKPCDDTLTIEVDSQPIAECEVVKVGDRFGVKVIRIIDHPEVWVPLLSAKNAID